MQPDDKTLETIRRMYAVYLKKKLAARDAVLLENCVVHDPPKSDAEAQRRNETRAEVDRFLWRCRIGMK